VPSKIEMGKHGLDYTGSGHGKMAGACDCGNKTSGSKDYKEVID
jgi:hypothetical protein